MQKGWKLYYEDRLVMRWSRGQGVKREIVSQGKRVGRDCPLTWRERRVYVTKGSIVLLRRLMQGRGLTLREAKDLLDSARFPNRSGVIYASRS